MYGISTRTHGILDLVTAGTLLTLPRVLGWSERLTNTLTGAALGTLGYSLLTNYEFGLVRVLPMRAHLALDAINGMAFCGAPWLFPEEDDNTRATLIGIGLFEIGAAFLTRTEPAGADGAPMAESLTSGASQAIRGYAGRLGMASLPSWR